ncbi:helix-turn-helix transcriptional regulator [Listeria welshimeri]|uniref:helix-turn-helix domain-containing protein n=1 Tax=Listeria TaxID=1637 RepID=UPI0010BC50D0|nr:MULTISPECIES: helix-turn-helix transcriptional regulator [Listeria]MBC1289142.1 helix-turn-helix transcriptional regulator [Listeria welshimeri]MBC1608779.1 helix-turn-helix transcriptional regulator [Listeria welshimeri]MBC1639848.1 helix-turn-helix transcriptional regulator [Listeria welshimeri]MBC1641860.1 helix-turn-helix transcriptional regulator [Listeria welshimeri]MBC1643745.1 helix-turn-helix transcriptional regulator [Listeria welshimeri]
MFDKNNIDKQVGKNIKRIRQAQGITQEELANRIGAIKQTVSKIERGVYSPTFKVLMDICNALNTTPNELLLVDTEWLEWREESIKRTSYSIDGIADEINIIEDLWANADFCRETDDEKGELFYLDRLIQMHIGSGNQYYRKFADFLYRERIEKKMEKAILEVRSNKLNNLRIEEKNKENID